MGLDTLLPGVNFQGNDLFGLRVSSVTTCATACKREPRCQAFTFITTEANSAKRCWLKNARYWRQVTHSSGTVSGKRREHERTTAAAQAMEAGPATRPVGDVYRTNRSDAADSNIRAEVSEVSDAPSPINRMACNAGVHSPIISYVVDLRIGIIRVVLQPTNKHVPRL